jgi:hypothetical protein
MAEQTEGSIRIEASRDVPEDRPQELARAIVQRGDHRVVSPAVPAAHP